MKTWIRGLVSGLVLGSGQAALAADLDYLRGSDVFQPGPATYFNWSGFYFGAHGGYGTADAEFGARADSLLNAVLATTTIPNATALASLVPPLSPDNASVTSFGGFAGYNTQWESAVLGIEANYHHTSLDTSALSSAAFALVTGAPPIVYNLDLSMGSVVRLTDYGTLRGRLGWAFGSFLPYATLGMALGRADITNSARVQYTAIDGATGAVLATVDRPSTEVKSGQFTYGYAIGLGVDWMVFSGLFLRAEYEFVEFAKFGDRALSLNTARAGLGYKF